MILFILSLIVGILSIIVIYKVLKNNEARGKGEIVLYGKKLGCEERFGTPIRYITKVEFVVNGSVKQKNIITTDKNIMKYMDNESIPLIYHESNNKVYWIEEKSSENIVIIILLVCVCICIYLGFCRFFINID